MTTWLLTGGAGYIGSHVARALTASGRDVVVLDDLSTGIESKIPNGVPFLRASVLDTQAVTTVLREHKVDGVIHLAAKKAVAESVEMPLMYYRENVGGLTSLLDGMVAAGTQHMVFSSSAAVYGTPSDVPVREDSPTVPESPYGETKLVGEWMVRDVAAAHDLNWAALRYFNVAGAGADDLGDPSANNLIPMVFAALARGDRPKIFGTDYPTPDGSCIRDYIHVVDLADAHVAAAAACEMGGSTNVYNVGTGTGYSVIEVMNVISEVIGTDVNAEAVGRRAGDPPATIAQAERIAAELGWRASRGLRDMVSSAWSARTASTGEIG